MNSIFTREIRAYFKTPVGYIFIGMFLAVSGYLFAIANLLGKSPNLGFVLSNMQLIFLFIIPILTMRLLSEEKNNKTDQLLLTSPVSVTDIVLGKFFAASAVYLLTLAITLLYLIVIAIHGNPAYGEIFCNYIGFAFLGIAFISVGIFVSSLTQSQAISAISTFAALLLLYVAELARSAVSSSFIISILNCVSITHWYTSFQNGVLSIPAILYFVSFSVVFILFTIKVIDRRRWI